MQVIWGHVDSILGLQFRRGGDLELFDGDLACNALAINIAVSESESRLHLGVYVLIF